MSETTPKEVQILDPHLVEEKVCDGPINVQWRGNRGTITCTHPRPKPAPLFAGKVEYDLVVQARIACPVESLISLRDTLNRLFPKEAAATPAPPSGDTGV